MKELNKKEWKTLQNFVKNSKENVLYVNISTTTLTINLNENYSDVIFDKKRR